MPSTDWMKTLAERIVQSAASMVHPDLRERLEDEWLADLDMIRVHLFKVLYAVKIWLTARFALGFLGHSAQADDRVGGIDGWIRSLSDWLVRAAARRFYPAQQDRFADECLAEVDSMSDKVLKLVYALGIYWFSAQKARRRRR